MTRPTVRPTVRPTIAALPAYSRAAGAGAVRWRASSNESTVPPSPRVVEAVARVGATSNRYPSLAGDDLVTAISARLGVGPENVVVGGGSLAVLQLALTAYTGPGTEVVHAWRSYEAYPILVGIADAEAVPVPLDAQSRHDVDAMLAAITERTAAVLVCDPNNPTGTSLDPAELRRLLAGVPRDVLVLLDQAYQEFDENTVDVPALIAAHPNVVVLRTFSKAYGLAGLRAGYAVGDAEVLAPVRNSAPPFGLSGVAEAAALAAWADVDHTAEIVATVTRSRGAFRAHLAERGLETPDARGNFVWLPVSERALELEARCVAHGVSVRAFAGEGVRVTVGDPAAEAAVLTAVEEFLVRSARPA
ncbi:histidinol-phosphate transaminase [Kineococcus rhizosphaerae]|uniref:Histidinol-phosphate aminotransferase n=1 Tax=Kineococcus rhizosphaerae TaxID=559628 RepID=A0A2T0QYS7_9ACTN|nr:histidinol-phosphate transaminase [Kineococcus rhizosphaerae]PRY11534.1 histidinol-phosphate aminotransferase [Kineococcus rhizosphaerae]